MPLDPQTQLTLARLKAMDFVLTRNMTPAQARKRERALTQLTASSEIEPIAAVADYSIPGLTENLPIRIYTPQGRGPFPVLIYFHSGGGVIGDLDSDDVPCRRLANLAQCLVVSVGYHLAPEYKFPFGLEECYLALQWIVAHACVFHGIPSQVAIGGMSAGGTIAAVLTHMARDRGGPRMVFQLLLVPLTDLRLPHTSSLEEYAEGYLLTREDILWFIDHYLNSDEDKSNPLASPYLASTFAGLPPALIITAEYDPLRDDGEHYGERLQEAGVPVKVSRRQGAIHGFIVPDQIKPALAEAATALRAAFEQTSMASLYGLRVVIKGTEY